MLMEYSFSAWLGILEYMIFVVILFTGACAISVWLERYFFSSKTYGNKLKTNKKIYKDKKKYFIDVA